MSTIVPNSSWDRAVWTDRADKFRALHIAGKPLILFNAWDAGSATAIAASGAPAIATSSWAVAAAQGYSDGEHLPLDTVLAILGMIVQAVDVPVSVDLEAGYGTSVDAVMTSVQNVIAVGAVGLNLEDQDMERRELRSIEDQSRRIAAARAAADAVAAGCFINARTDLFWNVSPDQHDADVLDEAVRRAHAYASAGADGFFTPGLRNSSLIRSLCLRCPLPVNIMVVRDVPNHSQLAGLGVSRISHGPQPYRLAMQALADAALRVYSGSASDASVT